MKAIDLSRAISSTMRKVKGDETVLTKLTVVQGQFIEENPGVMPLNREEYIVGLFGTSSNKNKSKWSTGFLK